MVYVLSFVFVLTWSLQDGMGTINNEDDDDEEESRPSKRAKTYPMEDLGILAITSGYWSRVNEWVLRDIDIDHEDNKKIPPVATEFAVPIECVGDLFAVLFFALY